ncbi:MAG: VWA domain-containing protein [Hyphomicrobiales bacterium]|nr:VWA domain-containing protein [Hyphomicrobiales bacterium]
MSTDSSCGSAGSTHPGSLLCLTEEQSLTITAGDTTSGYINALGFRNLTTGESDIIFSDDDAAAGMTFDLGSFQADTKLEFFILQDGGTEITSASHIQRTFNADGTITFGFEDLFQDPTQNPLGLERDDDFDDVVFNIAFSEESTEPEEPTDPTEPTVPTEPEDNDQTATSDPVDVPGSGEVVASITTEAVTADDTAELEGVISLTGFLGTDANIVFINDASGSVFSSSGLDLDGDGSTENVFEVDVAAFEALNSDLIDGSFGGADLGVISFGSGATTDGITTPGADADGNGTLDAIEILTAPGSGGVTNFAAPLQQAINFFNSQPSGESNFVYFLSDGGVNAGGDFTDEVAVLSDANGINATIQAFGVVGALQDQLDLIDNTGGAQLFDDIADLSSGITASPVDPSNVSSIDILVNGAVQQTLGPSDLNSSATGISFGPVTLTDLDPNAVNPVDIEAVLTANDGSTFDLIVNTEIVGVGTLSDADAMLI